MTRAARGIDTLARSLALARSASGDCSGLLAGAAHFHKQGRCGRGHAVLPAPAARHPDHPEGLHGLGLLAHQSGDHDQAIRLVERAVALSPEVGRYHYHLGLALAAVQRYEAAEQAFARAQDLDPDWSDARANRERVRRLLESHR